MSRRVDLPTVDQVRQGMLEYIAESEDAGTRVTVIGLARRLNLSNGTFWRQFPAIADELKVAAVSTSTAPRKDDRTELRADNARLRRENASLRSDINLAVSSIQRLALESRALRTQLEQSAKIGSISQPFPAQHSADQTRQDNEDRQLPSTVNLQPDSKVKPVELPTRRTSTRVFGRLETRRDRHTTNCPFGSEEENLRYEAGDSLL